MTSSSSAPSANDETIRFHSGVCDLGTVLVARSSAGVCALEIGDDHQTLIEAVASRFRGARLIPDETLSSDVDWVMGYIERPIGWLVMDLDLRGSDFEISVWKALQTIEAGTTLSYGALAHTLGNAQSARAVANACGHNPVAVVVPCHRVIREGGGLGGWHWGTRRKAELLAREKTLRERAVLDLARGEQTE